MVTMNTGVRKAWGIMAGAGELGRSIAGTAMIRTAAMGLSFLTSLVLARILGPHDYGLYAYLLSCIAVATIPSSLGIPGYLVREGAHSPGQGRHLLHWADRRIHLAGIVTAVGLAAGYLVPDAAGARWLFLVAAPVPWLTNLSSVRQSLLQAYGRIAGSQWPQLLLAPAVILVAVVALWLAHRAVSPLQVMIVSALAAVLPLWANAIQLRTVGMPASPQDRRQDRVANALPFMWLNALFLVNSRTDLIFLGAFKGAHEAGVYAVAARAAEVVSFFLIVMNLAIGPRIAKLHRQGDSAQLQILARRAAGYVFAATAIPASVMIIGADFLLFHFYGPAYEEAASPLRILALSQLLCAVAGPVGILLNMTEHTALSARAFALSAALNVVMILALVPPFGVLGAATATATSTVCCCLLRWVMVRRYLTVRPSCLGI